MVNGAQKGIVTIARRLGVQYDYVTVTAHADMRIECSADVCLCGLFRKWPQRQESEKRPERQEKATSRTPLRRENRRVSMGANVEYVRRILQSAKFDEIGRGSNLPRERACHCEN